MLSVNRFSQTQKQGLKPQRAGLKAQRVPEGLGGGDLKAASTQQANKANPSEIPVPSPALFSIL
jgi:hypothetical protein